jgi:murein L,D-transpeptidase YafK
MPYHPRMKWWGWLLLPMAGVAYLLAQNSHIPEFMIPFEEPIPATETASLAVDAPAGPARAKAAAERVKKLFATDLAAKNLHWGDPVYLRAFKEEGQLELFVKDRQTKRFVLFRTYPIARQSGRLGPKLSEGDGQVPEGFYAAGRGGMKSDSTYHLAINIGYPNEFDRSHNRTGSFIMIHGNHVSIGCLAMTDEKVEEIYSLCDAALQKGQPFFRVHIFPFRMSKERMERAMGEIHYTFWQNLQEGYQLFEEHGLPAETRVENQRYRFTPEVVSKTP